QLSNMAFDGDVPRRALVDEIEKCCIYFDPLTSKPISSLSPCLHSLHSECADQWLTSRTKRDDQICPLSRQKVDVVVGTDGVTAPPPDPQGRQEEEVAFIQLVEDEEARARLLAERHRGSPSRLAEILANFHPDSHIVRRHRPYAGWGMMYPANYDDTPRTESTRHRSAAGGVEARRSRMVGGDRDEEEAGSSHVGDTTEPPRRSQRLAAKKRRV
ncbi:hypothetical protein PENTCL1PPCAC_13924, partial [Pristionchus entomophagus]